MQDWGLGCYLAGSMQKRIKGMRKGYEQIMSRRDLISVELNETNDLVPLGTIYE